MRLSPGPDEVLRLAIRISDPQEALQIKDAGFEQQRQEPLEQLGRDVGIPDGRVSFCHGDVEQVGEFEEA